VKVIHRIAVEGFLYPTEDMKKVKKAFCLILPDGFDFKQDKIESEYGPVVVRLSYETDKAADIKTILERIRSGLSDADRKKVIDTIDQRLSEEGHLYLRFDKQRAFKGKLALKYTGDVIKTRIKIASYPATLSNLKYNAQILFE
jgi:RNA binding exosome subunit